MTNILICDDEKDIVKALKIYLGSNPDYNFFEAYDGAQALEIVDNNDIQLILLDVMMPKMDGISVLSTLREEGNNVPVIFITAKSEPSDVVMGLNIGADDYICKPFNPLEVTARVSSALRRYTQLGSASKEEDVYELDGLKMDDRSRVVTVEGKEVILTPTEYGILKLLLKNLGQVFSSQQIYESVWNETSIGNEQSVAVHIRHLREKIEIDPSSPRYIKVVWGVGYCIKKEK